MLGNPVVITCRADGFPTPTVLWKQAIGEQTGEYRELGGPPTGVGGHRGGSGGTAGDGHAGVQSHPNGSLIIPRVGKEHASNFLCQATNGIGADLSKLIRLTVHGTFGVY